MKTITVNVSEPVYKDFQDYARKEDRKASELIREAMEMYRRERITRAELFNLKNAPLAEVGDILIPLAAGSGDLLEGMTDDRRY